MFLSQSDRQTVLLSGLELRAEFLRLRVICERTRQNSEKCTLFFQFNRSDHQLPTYQKIGKPLLQFLPFSLGPDFVSNR